MPPVYGMLHARIRHTAENFERRGVIIKPPQTVMSPPIENHRIGNVGDEPGISLFVVIVSVFVNL